MDFLERVFLGLSENEIICIQNGVSSKVHTYPSEGEYSHFNISTLKEPCRRYSVCSHTYCIVFDDIGTKAERQQYVVPHWSIETSEGNYQDGFIIVPQACTAAWRATFNDLIRRASEAGYTDPGATSPNRLVRLPGSRKPGSTFRAQLVKWLPLLPPHDFQTFCEKLKLKYTPKTVRPSALLPAVPGSMADTNISLDDDAIAQWLMSIGASPEDYEGAVMIPFCCPFQHESGNSSPRDAAYWPHTKRFSCFHGTCKNRSDMQARFRHHIAKESGLHVKTREAQIITEAQRRD